jgi:signal transduction histidine kinase
VPHRSANRTLILATLALLLSAWAPRVAAPQLPAVRPTRVLVLYQQQAETQPMLDFTQRLRATITRELGRPVAFYQEAMDFDRFTGRERATSLSEYLDDKYRGFGIDVVVPVGGRALRFAVEELDDVLPKVPIVFALCASPQTDPTSLPARVTGRLAASSRFVPTLQMARRLQPDAERIVVVGGAGSADSTSVAAAVRAVPALRDSLPLTVLQGLSLDVLLPKLRQLDRRSIVLFANYRQNDRGEAFEPLDIVGSIARASSAPMYAQLDSYVGEGIVGGSVLRFGDEGAHTGQLVVRVLRRRPGAPMPAVEPIAKSFVADWRQLRRFGLSERDLPPGTALLFREPTLWERYHTVILLAAAVILAELVLIGALLVERRRRRRAQAEADEQHRRADEIRRQVTHMGRVAMLGELAATMSHELRQPLAAIRANAETGVRLATGGAGRVTEDDRALYAEIFDAIVSDDARASDIITRIRALVRREALPQRPVDLNDVCRTAARLLQYEAKTRRADLVLSLDPALPLVSGDPIQLQQVVLNLMLNGLDASASSQAPRLAVSTAGRDEEVEVAVGDNGPGISDELRQHLFESFFTTKPGGLGLGLAIVQSIVERHRGRVEAENAEHGGAIFRVVVPGLRGGRVDPSEVRPEFAAETPMAHQPSV